MISTPSYWPKKSALVVAAALLSSVPYAIASEPSPYPTPDSEIAQMGPPPGMPMGPGDDIGRGPHGRPMGPRGPMGRWWNNPEIAARIKLTEDQKKKMDDVLQQSRLRLIDQEASLRKEEVILEPLMDADQPDETKILSQIDKVAQARAELEKANARMLLGFRRVLTPDQWKQLHEDHERGDNGSRRRPMRQDKPGPDAPGPDKPSKD